MKYARSQNCSGSIHTGRSRPFQPPFPYGNGRAWQRAHGLLARERRRVWNGRVSCLQCEGGLSRNSNQTSVGQTLCRLQAPACNHLECVKLVLYATSDLDSPPSRCIKWMLTPASVQPTPCPPHAGRRQTLALRHRCSSPSTPRRPAPPPPRPPPPQRRCPSHWQGRMAAQALRACRQQTCGCMSPHAEAARQPAHNAHGLHVAHLRGLLCLFKHFTVAQKQGKRLSQALRACGWQVCCCMCLASKLAANVCDYLPQEQRQRSNKCFTIACNTRIVEFERIAGGPDPWLANYDSSLGSLSIMKKF